MTTAELGFAAAETQTPDEKLNLALNASYDIPFDPQFEAECIAEGIDMDESPTPQYWDKVADYAARSGQKAREQGESESVIALTELLAATPDYLIRQARLDKDNQSRTLSSDERREDRGTVSYFNGLIREVAAIEPGMSASSLAKHMAGVAVGGLPKPMHAYATDAIRSVVRGAQHEAAFKQLLEHTGRSYREATLEEDLRGIDYAVTGSDGSAAYIDVKASLSEIERLHGENTPFVRKPDGKIVMYSMVTDKELADRFHVDDATAQQRAKVVVDALDTPAQRSAG